LKEETKELPLPKDQKKSNKKFKTESSDTKKEPVNEDVDYPEEEKADPKRKG